MDEEEVGESATEPLKVDLMVWLPTLILPLAMIMRWWISAAML